MISATNDGKRTGEPLAVPALHLQQRQQVGPEGAYEFIKFASSADEAGYFASVTGYLATNTDV